MAALINIESLMFFLLCWALIAIILALSKTGAISLKVRRLYQLDGLDELIGSCAERGRSLAISNRYYDVTQPQLLNAMNYTIKYIGEKASVLNIPVFAASSRPQAIITMEDWLRQGYIAAGYPERFVGGRFIASNQQQIAMIGHIQRENAGGVVGYATGNRATIFYEAALRQGALLWVETTYGFPSCWNAIMADWYLNGDELNALGAYVSGDEQLNTNLLSVDAVKIMFVIGYLAASLTKFMGLW